MCHKIGLQELVKINRPKCRQRVCCFSLLWAVNKLVSRHKETTCFLFLEFQMWKCTSSADTKAKHKESKALSNTWILQHTWHVILSCLVFLVCAIDFFIFSFEYLCCCFFSFFFCLEVSPIATCYRCLLQMCCFEVEGKSIMFFSGNVCSSTVPATGSKLRHFFVICTNTIYKHYVSFQLSAIEPLCLINENLF